MGQFSRSPLSDNEIAAQIVGLPTWISVTGNDGSNQLVKTYLFGTFKEAMSFILRIAFEAESLDHHPEIKNVYNKVVISLATHDAGNRITELDVELAKRIEQISWV